MYRMASFCDHFLERQQEVCRVNPQDLIALMLLCGLDDVKTLLKKSLNAAVDAGNSSCRITLNRAQASALICAANIYIACPNDDDEAEPYYITLFLQIINKVHPMLTTFVRSNKILLA